MQIDFQNISLSLFDCLREFILWLSKIESQKKSFTFGFEFSNQCFSKSFRLQLSITLKISLIDSSETLNFQIMKSDYLRYKLTATGLAHLLMTPVLAVRYLEGEIDEEQFVFILCLLTLTMFIAFD